MADAIPAVMVQNDIARNTLVISAGPWTVPLVLDNAVEATDIEITVSPKGGSKARIALSSEQARELVNRIRERLEFLVESEEKGDVPDPRVRLWVAEFTGPHIEGTAYLALPKKQDGYETPYILESVVEVEASRMWAFITTSLCDLAEALPGGKDHPVEQERLAIIAEIKRRSE